MYFHTEIILHHGDADIYLSMQDFIKTLLKSEYGNTLSVPVQWNDQPVSLLYTSTHITIINIRAVNWLKYLNIIIHIIVRC